jgi:hypothetical protein
MRAPWLRLALGLIVALSLLLPALAAGQDEDPAVIYKKTTIYDIRDGDVIEVDIRRPDGDLYKGWRTTRHQSLIRLRENWDRSVLETAGKV